MKRKVLKKAIEMVGIEEYKNRIATECVNLALYVNKDKIKNKDKTIELVAEVKILMEIASIIFGELNVENRIKAKIDRLDFRINRVKNCKFTYKHNNAIISKEIFTNAVPKNWMIELDEYGEYSYGYYRAIIQD